MISLKREPRHDDGRAQSAQREWQDMKRVGWRACRADEHGHIHIHCEVTVLIIQRQEDGNHPACSVQLPLVRQGMSSPFLSFLPAALLSVNRY